MTTRSFGLDDRLYQYLLDVSLRETPAQRGLRERTDRHEWAVMRSSAEQGQFLALLLKVMEARRAVEVGVYTGYATLTLAQALPQDGYVLACDTNADFAAIGQPFWEQAGVADKIDLRIAPAQETLEAELKAGGEGLFDFAFIDADKEGYDGYYEACLALVRRGGVVAIDNVLWSGLVADPDAQDDETRAIRTLNNKVGNDDRVDIAMIPISDGLTLARKR